MPGISDAVAAYGAAAKDRLTVTGDPEAAIRAPLEGLLGAMATVLGQQVVPHSESRLDDLQVRPDYAIRVDGAITGYLEVKRPRAPIDPERMTGHNKKQ